MIKNIYEKMRPFIPMIIIAAIALYYLKVLTPFVVSIVIAYILNPLVILMEKKMKRWAALSIIMGGLILAVGIMLVIIIPGIINEVVTFSNNFPDYINKIKEYSNINFPYKNEIIQKIYAEMSTISKAVILKSTGIFLGGMTIIGYAISVPIFTFYMLKDKEIICDFFWKFVPEKNKKSTLELLMKIDKRMKGFLKGQFLDFLVLGILLSVVFLVLGVNNGIAIAFICAAFNLVPYLGMVFSFILITGVSWFQSFNIIFLVKVLIGFGIVQSFENMIMSPKLIGSNAKVHPLAIVLAMMMFGGTFGIKGVIFAIPGLIVIDVLLGLSEKKGENKQKDKEKNIKISLTDIE